MLVLSVSTSFMLPGIILTIAGRFVSVDDIKINSGNISLYGKSLMETIAVQHSKSSSTLFMYGFIGAFTVFAVAISLFIFMKKRKQK
jgi:hypothetical protein